MITMNRLTKKCGKVSYEPVQPNINYYQLIKRLATFEDAVDAGIISVELADKIINRKWEVINES